MGLCSEYLSIQQRFERKYGKNTVTLMQIGSFYEILEYIPDHDGENIVGNESSGNVALRIAQTSQIMEFPPNMVNLSETDFNQPIGNAVDIALILNMRLTSKNKGNPHSIDNPYLVGFPCIAYENHRDLILMHGYTIIRIDQKKNGNNILREIAEISSPGTEIDNSVIFHASGSNSVVSIYIECQNQRGNKNSPQCCENNLILCGMSWIDITTGQTIVCETYSKEKDEIYAIHEVYRFIHVHQPAEIIINVDRLEPAQEENYKNYLREVFVLDKIPVQILKVNDIDPNYLNLSYQEEFLSKVYRKDQIVESGSLNKESQIIIVQPSTISLIEELDLELYTYGRISFILLLQHCYEHNESLIKCLTKPQIRWSDQDNHLILTHNAVDKLEILPKYTGPITRRKKGDTFDSLISVLDGTSTSLGSRFLRRQLLNPLTDTNQLEMYYAMTEDLMTNDEFVDSITVDLRKIPDIERLQRKIQTGLIRPKEFANLFQGYIKICEIYTNLLKYSSERKSLLNLSLSVESIDDFNECLSEVLSTIDLSILSDVKSINKNTKFHTNNSFIRRGINSNIDQYVETLQKYRKWLQDVCDHLNALLSETRGKMIEPKFERSGDDGMSQIHIILNTTKHKANVIKKNINSVNTSLCGSLEFIVSGSGMVISSEYIRKCCFELSSIQIAMEELLLQKFNELVKSLSQRKFFNSLNKFVATVDFLKNNARLARKYKYSRPQIDNNSTYPYLQIKNLRHPLIERISRNEYIANDISLGISQDIPLGLLLFGINSTGKTSLAKATALAVIMAQAGMYVAGEMIYRPYSKIITRLSGHDDIFKGQSSFVVEMTELRTILRSGDETTLVIGDELCRGTETNSGTALTVATIETLLERKTSFIFSTHMHVLPSMDIIKRYVDERKLRIAHLTATYDCKLDELVYNRKLMEGSGTSLYGLEVCRSLSLDKEFISKANVIRKGLEGRSTQLISTKQSRYNTKIYVDRCSLCSKSIDLQTHHIHEQAQADSDGHIGCYHKNARFNLLVICSDCHKNLHANGTSVVQKQTLNGVYLTLSNS